MSHRRDHSADVFTRDGLLRRVRLVGHCDAEGRVRERDGAFFRGEELGVVDDRGRIRRKGGIVGRGEAVGRIRGNAVFTMGGLWAKPVELGRVDAEGRIWQHDCALFRGREIGRASGADPEMGLAFFVLKFQGIADHVVTLEQKVAESDDRAAFLPRVRATRNVLAEVEALGDFDGLARRLTMLERLCLRDSADAPAIASRSDAGPAALRSADRLLRSLGESRYRRAEVALGRLRERLGDAAEDTLRRLNEDDPTIAEAELVEELCAADLHAEEPALTWTRSPSAFALEAVQRLSNARHPEPRAKRPSSPPRPAPEVQDAILVPDLPAGPAANDQGELVQLRAYLDEVLGAPRADQLKAAVVAGLQEVLGFTPEEQAERLRRFADRLTRA